MKYLYQAGIIFLFTFLGEALARLIPFPIPAAIWGLLLLFLALCLKLHVILFLSDKTRRLRVFLQRLTEH